MIKNKTVNWLRYLIGVLLFVLCLWFIFYPNSTENFQELQQSELDYSSCDKIIHKKDTMNILKFIYVLHLLPEYQNESNWTEETNEIISTHFNYLKQLNQDGKVFLAGKTDYSIENPSNFGIVILSVKDLKSARQIMENAPAITQRIMTSELHPFSLSLIINPTKL